MCCNLIYNVELSSALLMIPVFLPIEDAEKSVDRPFTTTLHFRHVSSLKGLLSWILYIKCNKAMSTSVSQACVGAALSYLNGMCLQKFVFIVFSVLQQ